MLLRRVIKTSGNARQAGIRLQSSQHRRRHVRLSDQRGQRRVLYFYSQQSCKAKQKFPFELLSDIDEKVCNAFGVMKDKLLYGRKVRGIERTTFVIDEKGRVAREWRGVKVPGHVKEVLNFVKAL